MTWIGGDTVSVRQSLLAILQLGPCYGYQLGAEFTRRSGASVPLNAGQIYNTLDRLERDALVTKREPDADGQVFYEITAAGRRDVADWFGSSESRPDSQRDDMPSKIALAVTLPGLDVDAVIAAQRAATAGALAEHKSALRQAGRPRSAEQLATIVMIESRILATEADLVWLDSVVAYLRDASGSGDLVPLPLRSDLPRRGRPAKSVEPDAIG